MEETEYEILIIGAGAAGLMAARELAKGGKKVIILEARERVGGRIHTFHSAGFTRYLEGGAEFVHGDLPVTQNLLQEASIALQSLSGKNYQVRKGELSESDEFIPDFDFLLEQLNKVKDDLPFNQFLDQYINEDGFQDLREAVIRFAEGYDAADIRKASTLAFREEWLTEGATNSFHPVGGYGQLIKYLKADGEANGVLIHLSEVVQEIKWQSGRVEVITNNQNRFIAKQVIITIPLGVLQATPPNIGAICFTPDLKEKRSAWNLMGFGSVIKVMLEFKQAFWEEEHLADKTRKMPDLSFLFVDTTAFTAWWTLLPNKTPLLTGWLGGPEAEKFKDTPEEEIKNEALASLAILFDITYSWLQDQLIASQVINWPADPFARGAYSYATIPAAAARQELATPLLNTLFFAGEAFYEGHAMGTVEAALASGLSVAKKILENKI